MPLKMGTARALALPPAHFNLTEPLVGFENKANQSKGSIEIARTR